MVTLAVVVILGTIAAPSIQALIKNNRISGQSIDFVGDLNLARSEAIKRAAPVNICKLTDPSGGGAWPLCNTTAAARWDFGWAVFVDGAGGTPNEIDNTDTIIKVHEPLTGSNTLSSQTDPGAANNPANVVVFTANGLTTLKLALGEQAIFRLCDSRGTASARTVSVVATGRIRASNTSTACP